MVLSTKSELFSQKNEVNDGVELVIARKICQKSKHSRGLAGDGADQRAGPWSQGIENLDDQRNLGPYSFTIWFSSHC